jgi:hypothetical protein
VSDELAALLRWETAGGTWEVLTRSASSVTVALCRCDGGEQVDELVLHDPDGRAYVDATD